MGPPRSPGCQGSLPLGAAIVKPVLQDMGISCRYKATCETSEKYRVSPNLHILKRGYLIIAGHYTCWGNLGDSIRSKKKNLSFKKSLLIYAGFPGGSEVKDPPAGARDVGSTPGLGRSPGEGNSNPLQYFLPGKSHRQRSLAGYSPWGCRETRLSNRTTADLLC